MQARPCGTFSGMLAVKVLTSVRVTACVSVQEQAYSQDRVVTEETSTSLIVPLAVIFSDRPVLTERVWPFVVATVFVTCQLSVLVAGESFGSPPNRPGELSGPCRNQRPATGSLSV